MAPPLDRRDACRRHSLRMVRAGHANAEDTTVRPYSHPRVHCRIGARLIDGLRRLLADVTHDDGGGKVRRVRRTSVREAWSPVHVSVTVYVSTHSLVRQALGMVVT